MSQTIQQLIESDGHEYNMQLPWFLQHPDEIGEAYLNADYLVLDFETSTLDYGDATNPRNELVCAAWYMKGTKEVKYHRGNEFQQQELLRDINEVLDNNGFLVAHNAKFEIKWLIRMGVDPAKILCYDTMLAEHVRRGNRMWMRVNLDETAQRYGCTSKAYYVDLFLKCGIDTREMPPHLVKARVVKDVKDTCRVFLKQREDLNRKGKLNVVGTRCIFTPVLAHIEMQGIFLDRENVEHTYNEVRSEYDAAMRDWNVKYGAANPRSTIDMANLIYGELKFKELKKKNKFDRNKPTKAFPDGAPKVDNDTLDKLVVTTLAQREFMELRRRIGKLNAQLSKTLDFYKGIIDTRPSAYFYGQFNQHIAQTHRLSSTSIQVEFEDGTKKGAQLQNQARIFKHLIGPGAGSGWKVGEVDGSQLEFRVAAFLGQDKQAIADIRNDVDRHAQTAKELFGYTDEEWDNLATDVRKKARQDAKAETFKPLYGGTRGTPEQERYYKWFREQFPELADTQQGWTYDVLANGSLKMPWGMEWFWPRTKQDPRSGYIDNTPSIYNYPVQSLATAEIIPIAVTYLWHRIRKNNLEIILFNTVHDSAVSRFPEKNGIHFRNLSIVAFTQDVYKYLNDVYQMDFNVPLGVGVTIGSRWASPDSTEFEINVEKDGTYWEKGAKGG